MRTCCATLGEPATVSALGPHFVLTHPHLLRSDPGRYCAVAAVLLSNPTTCHLPPKPILHATRIATTALEIIHPANTSRGCAGLQGQPHENAGTKFLVG